MGDDAMKGAINNLIAQWNTKAKQRVALPPDWHAWMRGLSECIDAVVDTYEATHRKPTPPKCEEATPC